MRNRVSKTCYYRPPAQRASKVWRPSRAAIGIPKEKAPHSAGLLHATLRVGYVPDTLLKVISMLHDPPQLPGTLAMLM
jgi:hypothetical protein